MSIKFLISVTLISMLFLSCSKHPSGEEIDFAIREKEKVRGNAFVKDIEINDEYNLTGNVDVIIYTATCSKDSTGNFLEKFTLKDSVMLMYSEYDKIYIPL